MSRNRSHWVAIGLMFTSLVGIVLGIATVSGFGSSSNGDVLVSSSAMTTNLLLALGALGLLGLDLAHGHLRPRRSARRISSQNR
jgi:hypothetical protein